MRRSGLKIMAGLIGLVKPMLHIMTGAVIMGTAGFLCAIFLTVLASMAVLKIIGFHVLFSTGQIFALMLLFSVLRGVLRYTEQACNHYIAFKILAVIRDKVFTVLRKLCPAKLEGKDKGNLISLITSDVELLEVFYAHTISPIVIAVLTSLIMLIFIGHYAPILSLIALAAYITVGVILPLVNASYTKNAGMEIREGIGDLNTLFLDSLQGLRELMQFNAADKKLNEINTISNIMERNQKSLKNAEGSSLALTDGAILIFSLLMAITALWLCSKGNIGFDSALLCTAALMASFGPVSALSNLSNTLSSTLASGERILSLLEETPEIEEIHNRQNIDFSGAYCKNLTFSYEKEKILENFSASFSQGKITGILGKSGCGKSTLLKLFMRFWDRNTGELRISETDIKNINTASLRQNESYCTQETHLFQDTIENNIKIGKMTASREEVIEAAKQASLHSFIETLPKGYDTFVGELGDTLSGGEKQRIGLARAFLSGTPFLLLDEPTSNLDSLNEGIILNSLNNIRKNKTIVLVSHRRSTLNIADNIINMESSRSS